MRLSSTVESRPTSCACSRSTSSPPISSTSASSDSPTASGIMRAPIAVAAAAPVSAPLARPQPQHEEGEGRGGGLHDPLQGEKHALPHPEPSLGVVHQALQPSGLRQTPQLAHDVLHQVGDGGVVSADGLDALRPDLGVLALHEVARGLAERRVVHLLGQALQRALEALGHRGRIDVLHDLRRVKARRGTVRPLQCGHRVHQATQVSQGIRGRQLRHDGCIAFATRFRGVVHPQRLILQLQMPVLRPEELQQILCPRGHFSLASARHRLAVPRRRQDIPHLHAGFGATEERLRRPGARQPSTL
eukprot:scaffold7339_cov249-Pinguiococcus_pyrenoidosus.AAC.33